MKININSSAYSGTVTLNPSLTIPSTTLNADNIIAQYEDLHQQIISAAELIDSRLQYVIEQALTPINWIIYQGKVLNASTVRLIETADIKLKVLPQLTFSVVENAIQLTITPTITAAEPEIDFQWMRSNRIFGIRVVSNNLISVGASHTPTITIVGTGQTVNFTTNTNFPVTATYNAGTGKYNAEFYITSSSSLAAGIPIITKIYVKRGGTETTWALEFVSTSSEQAWTWDDTSTSVIRGE